MPVQPVQKFKIQVPYQTGALHLRENGKIITLHLHDERPYHLRKGIYYFSISNA